MTIKRLMFFAIAFCSISLNSSQAILTPNDVKVVSIQSDQSRTLINCQYGDDRILIAKFGEDCFIGHLMGDSFQQEEVFRLQSYDEAAIQRNVYLYLLRKRGAGSLISSVPKREEKRHSTSSDYLPAT